MSTAQKSPLDGLFSEFEARREQEQEAYDKKRAREADLRDKALSAIEDIVSPIIQSVAEDIKSRGYYCKIEGCATLRFLPDKEIRHNSAYASKLSFEPDDGGRVRVKQQVISRIDDPSDPSRSGQVSDCIKDLKDLKKGWIRSQVERFVEGVLKSY